MTQDKDMSFAASPTDNASRTQWSRRRLLKELGRAHGTMAGLLILPAAWTKPIMEFAAVGTLSGLSTAPNPNSGGHYGTPPPSAPGPSPTPTPTCATGTVNLVFPPSNFLSTVNFGVYWWQATPNFPMDISVTLNRQTGGVTISDQGTLGVVSLTASTAGTYQPSSRNVVGSLSNFSRAFTIQCMTSDPTRTYGNQPEQITLDLVITGGTNASVTLSNVKSSHCF